MIEVRSRLVELITPRSNPRSSAASAFRVLQFWCYRGSAAAIARLTSVAPFNGLCLAEPAPIIDR